DARELGDRELRLLRDVADRAAIADGRVEGAVREAREVDDVADDALPHVRAHAGRLRLLPVQIKLPWRDVEGDHVGADPGELDREASGTCAGVEHEVADTHESLEHAR